MKQIKLIIVVLVVVIFFSSCSRMQSNSKPTDSIEQTQTDSSDKTVEKSDSNENNFDAGDPQGKTNLVSIGTKATATFANRYGVKHTVSICVEEVIRGEAALSFINESMLGARKSWSAKAPDKEDEEYLVAKISYSLIAYDDGDVRNASFCNAYSETFEAYPSFIASMFYDEKNNYPQLSNLEVKVGETVTAYEIFQIKKNDLNPMMVYSGFLADLSDGLWFKL